MKRTFTDSLMFFLAMNFIGIVAAIGAMIIMGKLNVAKLQDIRLLALDEVVIIKPEKIKEFKELEEKYNKLKKEDDIRTKHEGLSNSGLYDNQILALKKREDEQKRIESQIKDESEQVKKKWEEVNQKLAEIKKRQDDYALAKKEDQERSKDDKLKILLKRYDAMEANNVAMALINANGDPKLDPPKMNDKEEDPRIKEAAFYLKEMKPTRSAEIMEAMGPLWTNALQKYMEKMPMAENNIPKKQN